MYLGLFLDAASKQKIAACLPTISAHSLPANLHVTIIHTKAKQDLHSLLSDCTLPVRLTLTGEMQAFGPQGKEQMVLMIEKNYMLGYLRGRAESALAAIGCTWSKEWEFNPHISLGTNLSLMDTARLKAEITYAGAILVSSMRNLSCDRLEWTT